MHLKSGLNQWNAAGRGRDEDEVYIPIPSPVRKKCPDFFPNRKTPFNLKLSNGVVIKGKICQDDGKSLMSHPNKALGKWMLRDILKIPVGELATYEKLQRLGIDSVRLDEIDNQNYEINFASIGSYERFIGQEIDSDPL